MEIENHRAVEYERRDHGLLTAFVVNSLSDGRGYNVTGECPGCGAYIRQEMTFGLMGTKGPRRRRVPQPGPRTVICDCMRTHPERPPEFFDQGCGAQWQVALP
jgi:hypothetical protein